MSNNYVKNRLGHHNRLHSQAKTAKKNPFPDSNAAHNDKSELLAKLKQKQLSKQMEETTHENSYEN